MMSLKSRILMTTAFVGLAASSAAVAQTTSAADGQIVEEVVVTGFRQSLQKAVEIKRAANANVDVITAEDIGKFPDINVAESLARLPGLSVDRANGEGEKLSILGIDSRLNIISLNNHPMATADYGDSSVGAGRSFNYSLLAPELIGQAEVYKSSEARLEEGSIGGSVIIHTRKPLDLPSNVLSASVGYSNNLRTSNGDGKGSLILSWKNKNQTFGVLASASYNNYTIGGTSISVFDYATGCDVANLWFWPEGGQDWRQPYGGCTNGRFNDPSKLPQVSSGPALTPTMRIPGSLNQGSFVQNRKRTTYSVAAQWKPVDDLELGVEILKIEGDYSSFSRSMQTDMGVYWNGSVKYGTLVTSGNNIVGGTALSLPIRQDAFYKKSELTNDTYDFTAKWTPNDWSISANLGRSKATGGTDPEYYLDFKGNVGATWSVQDQKTSVTFSRPLSTPGLLRSNTGNTGFVKATPFTDTVDYGIVDVDRPVELGPITKIRFGARTSDHKNSRESLEYNIATGANGVTLQDFETFVTPEKWARGLGASGDLLSYTTITQDSFINYAESHQAVGSLMDRGWEKFSAREKISSVYLQADFQHDKLRGNVGARYAQTKNAQTYWADAGGVSSQVVDGVVTFPGNTYTTKTDYGKFLPAANLVYSLQEDTLLRLNLAKVIARPSFDQLSGSVSLDPQKRTASGGNPYLKPYEATNYGLSLERYFKSNGYVSLDLFYRDVGSYIVTKSSNQTFTVPANYIANNPGTPSTQTFLLTAPLNANGAKVRGAAVAFQSDIAWGFGVQTNLTYTDAKTSPFIDANNPTATKMHMPYLSRYLFNLTPYYEHGPLQVRLSYSYRTKYLTTVGVDKASGNNYTPRRNQLDFSATYKFNEQASIVATASNLLDELEVPYRDDTANPLSWTRNGTVATVSFSYKMF